MSRPLAWDGSQPQLRRALGSGTTARRPDRAQAVERQQPGLDLAALRVVPPRPPVRVLVVDESTAMRQAIVERLKRENDLSVVGEAGSIAEARELLFHVDVAVLALHLPDGLGSDIIGALRAWSPRAEAVIVEADLEPASVARAVRQGAGAVLDKAASIDEVVAVVRRVHAGATVLPRDAIARLLSHDRLRRDRARQNGHVPQDRA